MNTAAGGFPSINTPSGSTATVTATDWTAEVAQSRTDSQQQQKMNRAAQEFTDALLAAYRTTSENTAVIQELGAQQIE